MLKSRWSWLVLAVLGVLALLGYWMLSLAPRMPVHDGKTFYQWATALQKAHSNYGDPDRWKKIETISTAIRAMGTNALPYVMVDLRARASLKDRLIAWLAPRATFLKLQPANVADRWVRGIRAMEVLGPLGKPYLPELITMASNTTGYAEAALIAVGPDALPAYTNLLANSIYPQTGNLIGAFANAVYANRITPEQAAVVLPYLVKVFQSPDSHGRWYAASAMGAVHQDPELCIPLLVAGLSDTNSSVRDSCVQSLGAFGEAASAHAPLLVAAYDGADPIVRRTICATLGNLRSAAKASLPVLIRAVRDPDENVRIAAVTSLGQLATSPEECIPALSDGVQDPNHVVRIMAVQSLGLFGPQASNAIPVVESARSDPDDSVRKTAATALRRIQGR